MIRFKQESESYIGGRMLAGTKIELHCSKCFKELDVHKRGVLYCKSLNRAWCTECFHDKVEFAHWRGTARFHEEIRIDKLEVVENDDS